MNKVLMYHSIGGQGNGEAGKREGYGFFKVGSWCPTLRRIR